MKAREAMAIISLLPYTWKEYAVAWFLVLAVYYGWIAFKFYRREIGRLLASRGRAHQATMAAAMEKPVEEVGRGMEGTPVAELRFDQLPDDAFGQVECLVADLKATISEAQIKAYERDALLKRISPLLAKYPLVNHQAFRESIDEFIVSECRTKGIEVLTEDQVHELWNRLG
jgi:hypothetical protein